MASFRAKRMTHLCYPYLYKSGWDRGSDGGGRLPCIVLSECSEFPHATTKRTLNRVRTENQLYESFFVLDHADSIWQNIFSFFFFVLRHPSREQSIFLILSIVRWHAASRCNESLLFVSTSGNILTDSSRYLLLVEYLWYFWGRNSVSLAYRAMKEIRSRIPNF